jgi:trimethylamine:corrinoid methyltransferase-like protein
MFQTSLLTDEQVEPLGDALLDVLERVGVLCQNDEMLRALAEWGAEADLGTERVRFPRGRVAEFVEGLRRETQGQAEPWGKRPGHPGRAGIGAQVAQIYRDHETGEKRSSNRDDFITLTKLGSALHPQGDVGHSLSMTDIPPLLEPLQAGLLLAEWAYVPGTPFVWRVDQADYLIEMGEILEVPQWFTWGAVCFAHPLRFDRDTAGKFARRVREGVATGLTGMPVAGVTTPVTLEGFIVVSSAEHIATWIAARAINPEVGLGGSMWPGTVDLKGGGVSYSAPDALLYGFAAVEFLRRWCGMRVAVGSGDYCDAKEPSLYAAQEKALKSMTVAAFTGQPLAGGSGLLDEGKILSPIQLMLDREFATAMGCLERPIDVTPERIGVDAIAEVGVGLQTSYLETEHTLRHFREQLWLPTILERAGYGGPEHDQRVVARARAQIDELLASYRKPEGREDQLAAMRAVMERARRELLG